MTDYPKLHEKLGPNGLEELRRLIAEEIARGATRNAPPAPTSPPRSVPGPDEDLRPRS